MPSINNIKALYRFIKKEFPAVKCELMKWEEYASNCAEEVLATQACASIKYKSFHALGGSVYSLYPGVKSDITQFIVAYQTISDYLDNLCDRAGIQDEKAFRQLHLAMTDSLTPGNAYNDYYMYYSFSKDGGYLRALVKKCKDTIGKLPSYNLVKDEVIWLASRYSELQIYKHIELEKREEKLYEWGNNYINDYEGLKINEFWSASGSTLGIFIMVAMATDEFLDREKLEKVKNAYFPWINGFHIMLDYLIDREEDLRENDLNFTTYYEDENEIINRIIYLLIKSKSAIQDLEYREFHMLCIKGMLAMYLSDKKVQIKQHKKTVKKLFKKQGRDTFILYRLCIMLRKLNYI